MAIITTDTHNFIARLKEAGMEEKQAVAIAEEIKEVRKADFEQFVVTKEDLRLALAELKAELLKWLIPILLGQIAVFAVVVKFVTEL